MTKVLIVDDHKLLRAAYQDILSNDSSITVLGEADTAASARELIEKSLPDIILLDMELPDGNGLDIAKRLKRDHPNIKILIITGYINNLVTADLSEDFANGYISKDTNLKEIPHAINAINAGQVYFSPDIANLLIYKSKNKIKTKSPFDILSERETEVLKLLLNGKKPNQIAKMLKLSDKTVNTFRYRIFEKLNINNDVELARLAIRYGLVEAEPDAV